MHDKYGVAHDNYCYPNSDVLINKLNIRNTDDLAEAETEFTTLRYKEYRSEPSSISRFTFDHLKELHHHLFQDLYEWAGEIRTIDISKGETRFFTSSRIEAEATQLFTQIPTLSNALNRNALVQRGADLYCEINLLHPFREGNERTQRLFFEEVMFSLGYDVTWPLLSQEQWIEANVAGVLLNLNPLEQIFEQALRKI
ncbi:Fic/DOC family protein [Idiomarina aminovorans]|uniref:Fic/DOC family protein n=1 Tax=Idiomarina aminovorans TaxID=2914829 RepID=UPI002003D4C3|nr:Fic family protein [Idiomarina sp. ATCH4]MCK7460191.1 Fic family protein [Idiomarina sp. ATCH4]